jgi:hypothetical protein
LKPELSMQQNTYLKGIDYQIWQILPIQTKSYKRPEFFDVKPGLRLSANCKAEKALAN